MKNVLAGPAARARQRLRRSLQRGVACARAAARRRRSRPGDPAARVPLRARRRQFRRHGGVEAGEAPEAPKPGEVVYADAAAHVLCRRWNWRQDARSLITPATRRAVVTVQSNGAGDVAAAADDLVQLIGKYCGGQLPCRRFERDAHEERLIGHARSRSFVMRRASILLVLSVALLAPSGGHAAPRKAVPPPACAGRDIFTAMKRSDPEGYARIRAAADAVPNTGAIALAHRGQGPAAVLSVRHHPLDRRARDQALARRRCGVQRREHRGARIPRERDGQVRRSSEMMAAKGFYADGNGLKDVLTPAELDTLRKTLAAEGLPANVAPSAAAMACGIHARASAVREAARRCRPCLSRSAHRARCDRAGQARGRAGNVRASRSARWTACRKPCRSGCSRRRSPPSACAMTRSRWCTAPTSRAISRPRCRSPNGSSSGPGTTPRRSIHSSATSHQA